MRKSSWCVVTMVIYLDFTGVLYIKMSWICVFLAQDEIYLLKTEYGILKYDLIGTNTWAAPREYIKDRSCSHFGGRKGRSLSTVGDVPCNFQKLFYGRKIEWKISISMKYIKDKCLKMCSNKFLLNPILIFKEIFKVNTSIYEASTPPPTPQARAIFSASEKGYKVFFDYWNKL